MAPERCLYTLLHAPREHHEALLRDLVTPVSRVVADRPELDSLFFARHGLPDWQLRFYAIGRPEWVEARLRPLVEERLASLWDRGLFTAVECPEYEREVDRYGGPEGAALIERIFHRDTLACLDLLEAEARGQIGRSRGEFSLVMTERLLDLLRVDRGQRLAFYRTGHGRALGGGEWGLSELRALEERYRELRESLVSLFSPERARDPEALWGGSEPARIAERCLGGTRPVVEELLEAHAQGRVKRDLPSLALSCTRMHANRLGIEATAEASLRYFMFRLYDEGAIVAG